MTLSTPIFRLPEVDRRAELRRYVGRLVEIDFDRHRDGSSIETLRGLLVAVASPYGPGPQSATVVLNTDDDRMLGMAAARIRAVRWVPATVDPGLPDPQEAGR